MNKQHSACFEILVENIFIFNMIFFNFLSIYLGNMKFLKSIFVKTKLRKMKSAASSNTQKSVSKKETSSEFDSKEEEEGLKKKKVFTKKKPQVPAVINSNRPNPYIVVAIGASAGGLEAITQLLQNISPNTGMVFIYVQHLSPDHKSMLTALLSKATKMIVQEVEEMDRMEPDNVYVIPYNKEIEVTDGHITLIPRSNIKTPNLSIDVLFSSLAETHKQNVIGIVLSGSANDGTRGLKEIKQAGGITFAQDDSAKFCSMPQSAIAEGVVDFVLSPKEIAKKLNWISKHPLVKSNVLKPAPEDEIENSNPSLKTILQILFKAKNVDFSHYKMNTIKRRMLRRMLINKIKTLNQYAEFIADKEGEIDLLYQDLLINVTGFFRDTDAFVYLKKNILPQLLKGKKPDDTLRIWVAACATGEEAYSIAMLLLEIKEIATNKIPIQIFATDLSAEAITHARAGEYTANQLKNVSPKQLQHFFTKSKDKYHISRSLRDICVFAQHNILKDPPFSRMDFISCRNFLIYLDISAQKKAISTFHYALNDGGCLMLGKSETTGTSAQLFSSLDKKQKFFIKKNNSGIYRMPDISPRVFQTPKAQTESIETSTPKKLPSTRNNDLGSTIDAILLENYMPASVIINYDLEILQFRGDTSLYLQHSSGRASFNILKMAHIEITFELRNAIHHAIKTKQTIRKMGIEMNRDIEAKTVQIVNIEVMPLEIEGEEPLLVVVFTGHPIEIEAQSVQGGKNYSIAKDLKIRKLEEELAAARSDMGSITQDQEAVNEELQSANEEIVSSNEELQSLNEELETSKEEIESTNEELITSNLELHARILQVEELYNYYETILATIHEPMLILDKNIRIKSVNIAFCKYFHVTEEESIGVLLYQLGNNQWNIPALRDLLEEIVPKNIGFDDFQVEHTFPIIGHRTLLLNAHRIIKQSEKEELIVLTITDITEVKRLAIELEQKKKNVIIAQLDIAEDAVKAKQQFLSNMSHEIRTPMNAIIGFTNVLLRTELSQKQKEYMNAIRVSGDALIILINDILDLAMVDAGKMTFKETPFHLSHSISTMLQLFEAKTKEKNIQLIKKYDEAIPQILIGDSMRLRQIVLNLLSNAVKFTQEGKITLSVRQLKEDEEKVSIEFKLTDTGIGIPKDRLGQIFNNFEQIQNNTSNSFGGTGLGLAIVKNLVELQGGKLIVDSELGMGSTFGFILNFKKTQTNPETESTLEHCQEKSLTDLDAKNVNVLIAEDIPLNQLLIKIIVDDFGFNTDLASNGKIVIKKMEKSTYDIILMDLQMPEMNGFETTDYIRNTMGSKIPIIALTADVSDMDVEKCTKIGMNDYISKPIDEKLLYRKIIKNLLKNKIQE